MPEQLTWPNFHATVLVPGEVRVHPVNDRPLISIFGDGTTNRVGLWVQLEGESDIPPELSELSFIVTRKIIRDRAPCLELATGNKALYAQFYHFALAVADRVATNPGSDPVDAVRLELQYFAELLEEKSSLSIERQIGLLGELIFLDRLIDKLGFTAVDAWLGPRGEPHDFRIGSKEFEIKTTTGTRRLHTIHGTEQLIPSDGCSLSLVSIMVGPPGSSEGFSLASAVADLTSRLSVVPYHLAMFRAALTASGLPRDKEAAYVRRFARRRPMGIVPVAGLPALTRLTLASAFGAESHRVQDLSYDLDVEGLESEDGTDAFGSLFPGLMR